MDFRTIQASLSVRFTRLSDLIDRIKRTLAYFKDLGK